MLVWRCVCNKNLAYPMPSSLPSIPFDGWTNSSILHPLNTTCLGSGGNTDLLLLQLPLSSPFLPVLQISHQPLLRPVFAHIIPAPVRDRLSLRFGMRAGPACFGLVTWQGPVTLCRAPTGQLDFQMKAHVFVMSLIIVYSDTLRCWVSLAVPR